MSKPLTGKLKLHLVSVVIDRKAEVFSFRTSKEFDRFCDKMNWQGVEFSTGEAETVLTKKEVSSVKQK